jgi:hypothetical protein
MRRSRAIRLTVLPVVAASALAFGQDRVCVDGTYADDCLQADSNISDGNGNPVSPTGGGVGVVYGGFGGYYTASHLVGG